MVDGAVTRFVRSRWGTRLDPVAAACSQLGRGGVLWLAIDAAAEARSSRRALPARPVVEAVGLEYGSSLLLARILRRRRPCHVDGRALIECPSGPGLPSYQAAAAFAGAHAIAAGHPRLAAPVYLAAGAVGLARVYCGVHHLTDVAAGAALGIGVAASRASRGR